MVAALLVVGSVSLGPIAVAQVPDDEPATTVTLPDSLGDSLPGPEAGPSPEDAGERGGWLQFTVFGAVMLAMAFIVTKLFRGAVTNSR